MYIIILVKIWVIWTDEVSNFCENALKVYLSLISFLPSISLSAISQTLLGISLQVLASSPSILPILSNLSVFDKIYPLSHKSNSSVRFILPLPRYIIVLLNFIFFCSISYCMWIPKCLWFILDLTLKRYIAVSTYSTWLQAPFLHEKCLSHTPFSVGLLILIIYIWG